MARSDDAVEVTISIRARPETVFRFLSTPEGLAQWFSARVDTTCEVGTPIRIHYQGGAHINSGTIVAIEPNRRLAFTWGSETNPAELPVGSTLVEVLLEETATGTDVTLRHTGLPNDAQRQGATMGWTHFAGQLQRLALEDDFARAADAAIKAYVDAWSETDGAKRRALLAGAVAANVSFSDKFAHVEGLDAFDANIAQGQRIVPGAKLTAHLPAQVTRRFAAYRWSIALPNGAPLGAGTNFVEFDDDSRIKRVVGFWD